MEKLLKSAIIAWNPIGAVRKSLEEGTLNIGAVVGPFLAVIVSCNLLTLGAQKFFLDSLSYATGTAIPTDNPLISNDFAQQFLSTIGVVVPILVVSILPRGVFEPIGKNGTIASLFIVMAGWSFYGAALGIPLYFISGVLVMSDPESGTNIFGVLSILVSIIILALTLFFWFNVLGSKLQLRGGSIALISLCYAIALTTLVMMFIPVLE